METILLVFFLNIKSSYLQNTEEPSSVPADTIQFLLINGQAWRVKTFALDHDVHVWSIGPMDKARLEELAISNTKKTYGDVLSHYVRVVTQSDLDSLEPVAKREIGGAIEIAKDKSFAFWVPTAGQYKTQSSPRRYCYPSQQP